MNTANFQVMSPGIKCVVPFSNNCFPNAKFIFITFESCDKTCSKIEKTWFLLVGWQKSIKNDE